MTRRRCNHVSGCKTVPYFNLPGEITPIRCAKHKELSMMNVVDKTCDFYGCPIVPRFNLPDIKKGLYCNKHKLPEMIDVYARLCKTSDCGKRAIYKESGEKIPTRGGEHAMIK